MDGGKVIACDTPAGLIRGLDLVATVSATIANGSDATVGEDLVSSRSATDSSGSRRPSATLQDALAQLPGVVAAEVSPHEAGERLTLKTKASHVTIVGLLHLASERGIVLDDLGSSRATLEDVFLARTGRTYEDETEPAGEDEPPKRGRRAA
jgi:ABC-2 type transport system ATP-binding protein